MNKLVLVFAIAAMLVCLNACKKPYKDVNDYIPKVRTLSVTPQPDGSVIVKGLVIASGPTPINYAGFCMDTLPGPDITTNQAYATTNSGDTFSCTYSSLNALKRYYFKAWVTNGEAYGTGSDIFVDSVSFDTSLIPCHLAPAAITYTCPYNATDIYTHFDPLTQSGTGYTFTAYTDMHAISYTFSQVPLSGSYTTTDADYPDSKSMIITFDGVISKAGAAVYIRQITNTTIEIVICDVQVFFSTYHSWYSMSTRFKIST